MVKRIFQFIIVVVLVVASFASAGGALAWSNCASYVTVQWGDTLSGIAAQCGTTVAAMQAANFILNRLRDPSGGLLRTYRAGKAHLKAYLEDYAYFVGALLDVYEAGGGVP